MPGRNTTRLRQCYCTTHECRGALVPAHVAASHTRSDLREKTMVTQSQLRVTGNRVMPTAVEDIGPVSRTFPHPICAPSPPLSPDVVFPDPPRISTSPVEQEMLDHGTLTGEDVDILTFGSALPNLGPNFHSPEALGSAVDYFQEYNARTSAGSRPLTSFEAHHLPSDPEHRAFERQLAQIAEEVCQGQNGPLGDGLSPELGNLSYEDGSWFHHDENDDAFEAETPDEVPHHGVDEDDPDPFLIDEEVRSDNIDFADIPEHISVIHAVVSWLHLQFHLPRIACNALLAIFTLVLLFFNPSTPPPFTTLQSGNRLLGVDKPVHTLPVCPTCHDVYPPATSPLCHDTCTSCNVDLFLPGQTQRGNARALKTPVVKYPYLPLSEQIASILKIPGIEATLDEWRVKPRTSGTYVDIFDGDICRSKLKGPDGKLFFSNKVDERHGPNGELRLGVNLGIDWYVFLVDVMTESTML